MHFVYSSVTIFYGDCIFTNALVTSLSLKSNLNVTAFVLDQLWRRLLSPEALSKGGHMNISDAINLFTSKRLSSLKQEERKGTGF